MSEQNIYSRIFNAPVRIITVPVITPTAYVGKRQRRRDVEWEIESIYLPKNKLHGEYIFYMQGGPKNWHIFVRLITSSNNEFSNFSLSESGENL